MGGEAPFTYRWGNQATTKSISVNKPGSYNVTVTDINGCSRAVSYKLETKNTFQIELNTKENALPAVWISGGVKPYSYQWYDNKKNPVISGDLKKGVYTIKATDASGCETKKKIKVE